MPLPDGCIIVYILFQERALRIKGLAFALSLCKLILSCNARHTHALCQYAIVYYTAFVYSARQTHQRGIYHRSMPLLASLAPFKRAKLRRERDRERESTIQFKPTPQRERLYIQICVRPQVKLVVAMLSRMII